MTFTTTQKVIKIGDSNGVTIPAKDLKRAGIKTGDEIKVTIEFSAPKQRTVDAHTAEVVGIARKLIERHKVALDNLSQR